MKFLTAPESIRLGDRMIGPEAMIEIVRDFRYYSQETEIFWCNRISVYEVTSMMTGSSATLRLSNGQKSSIRLDRELPRGFAKLSDLLTFCHTVLHQENSLLQRSAPL